MSEASTIQAAGPGRGRGSDYAELSRLIRRDGLLKRRPR
jgi:hypothetical protein